MKKKMGRPKVAKSQFKGEVFGARLAPGEAKQVRAAIEHSKQGKSQWVRNSLLQAAKTARV